MRTRSDTSDGTATNIVATIDGLPSSFVPSLIGTIFTGVITVIGTLVAPLNNGLATFAFLTSFTDDLIGVTITQTVNGVTQSLTIIFTTPFTLLTAFIGSFIPAAVQGQENFDGFFEMLFQSAS